MFFISSKLRLIFEFNIFFKWKISFKIDNLYLLSTKPYSTLLELSVKAKFIKSCFLNFSFDFKIKSWISWFSLFKNIPKLSFNKSLQNFGVEDFVNDNPTTFISFFPLLNNFYH